MNDEYNFKASGKNKKQIYEKYGLGYNLHRIRKVGRDKLKNILVKNLHRDMQYLKISQWNFFNKKFSNVYIKRTNCRCRWK